MTAVVDDLDSITLHVTDLEPARRFYGDVLGLRPLALPPGTPVLLYEIPGGARLLAHVQFPDEPGRPAGGATGLMLAVRDCAKATEEVRRRGGTVVDEPWKAPFGATVATVADPSGNEIVLIQRDHPLPR